MNNDLISRSELLKKAVNMIKYDEEFGDVNVPAVNMWDVEEAPAVDAEPVVHAYWEQQGNDIVCSGENGCYEAMHWLAYIAQDYFGGNLPEYCPHCGATMGKKEV